MVSRKQGTLRVIQIIRRGCSLFLLSRFRLCRSGSLKSSYAHPTILRLFAYSFDKIS